MKKSNFVKDALILFVITLILGIALSFVEQITETPIKNANEQAILDSYKNVCPDFEFEEEIIDFNIDNTKKAKYVAMLIAKNKNNEEIGYIVTTEATGYGGKIKIIIGFDNDLKITGISYPETLSETPGLGMKVTDPDKFVNNYIGKTDDDITNGPTISGATISSSAVKEGIVLAYQCAKKLKGERQ